MRKTIDTFFPLSSARPMSRRTALVEWGKKAIVLAVPIGAVFVTANPIANPSRRKTLEVMTDERLAELRRLHAAKARLRAVKEQTKDRGRQPARKSSQGARGSEQRA